MFQILQEYFVLDTDQKKEQFLQQFTLRFKEHKSNLYIKYVKDSTPAEALDRCSNEIHPSE